LKKHFCCSYNPSLRRWPGANVVIAMQFRRFWPIFRRKLLAILKNTSAMIIIFVYLSPKRQ
jgi:hypothetical protein